MNAIYRQIEGVLVAEELHDALDVVPAGVQARHRVWKELLASDLRAVGDEDLDADGWDESSQIEY